MEMRRCVQWGIQAALVWSVLGWSPDIGAIPASPNPIPLKNSDGTTVWGRMYGDEHLSWIEDAEGYALAFERATGTWNYALPGPDGRPRPTAFRHGSIVPELLGLSAKAGPGPRLRQGVSRHSLSKRLLKKPRERQEPIPEVRTIPNLVLLVQFDDQTPHFKPSDFEPILNGRTASVRAYYQDVSYGAFDLVSTVVGWVKLPNPARFYAYNDVHPDGQPERMIADAVAVLDAQGFDFSPFDSDSDGYVDAVDVIHSGNAYETTGNPDYIHSHFSPLAPVTTASGLRFPGYHTEAEFGPDGVAITQIGVICHETAHFFGAPDLYDYGYDSAGLGLWSLMARGAWNGPGADGTRPSRPDAWTASLLGFVVPTRLTEPSTGVRVAPVGDGPLAYRIDAGASSGEYFLLENRQRTGWDEFLPANGLALYHVDENMVDNDDQDHYLVDLEQADGRRDLNRSPYASGDAGDLYPLLANNNFSSTSRPSSASYGPSASLVSITGISRVGMDVTFDLGWVTPKKLGLACTLDGDCASGFCVTGVCCESACEGECRACSKAAGGRYEGRCSGVVTGRACNDSNRCTVDDVCSYGVCQGKPKSCPAATACQGAATCDPLDGECLVPIAPNGTTCDDGNACTLRDQCISGACQGLPVVCSRSDACHGVGTCDSKTGTCSNPVLANGASCGGRSSCEAGVCVTPPEPEPAPEPNSSCGGCSTGVEGLSLLPLLAVLLVARRRPRQAGGG